MRNFFSRVFSIGRSGQICREIGLVVVVGGGLVERQHQTRSAVGGRGLGQSALHPPRDLRAWVRGPGRSSHPASGGAVSSNASIAPSRTQHLSRAATGGNLGVLRRRLLRVPAQDPPSRLCAERRHSRGRVLCRALIGWARARGGFLGRGWSGQTRGPRCAAEARKPGHTWAVLEALQVPSRDTEWYSRTADHPLSLHPPSLNAPTASGAL